MEVHETVKTMRKINDFTQEDMAEKLGISVNAYSKLECGKSRFSLEKLEQIANIFNINMSELYSAKEKGFLCFFSDNNSQNTYYSGDESLTNENEKLKLIIAHKEELLQEKETKIKMLEEIISLLKAK